MPVLLHPDTIEPESIAPEQVPDYLKRGYKIPLNSPEGELIAAEPGEAADQLKNGFSHPSAEQLQQALDYKKYNTPQAQLTSALSGAVEAPTFGLAGVALGKVAPRAAEYVRKAEEYNPGTNTVGQLAGALTGAGLIGGAGEAAGKAIVGEGLKQAAKRGALRGAVEGGLFGLAHEISERGLGDPNALGESTLSHVGLSAVLGGTAGLFLNPALEKFFPAHALKENISNNAASVADPAAMVSNPVAPDTFQPQNVADIAERVKNASPDFKLNDQPSVSRLRETEQLIPDSQFPVHELQYQSLENPETRMQYKTDLESGTPETQALRDYESYQKQEGVNLTKDTIQRLAPTVEMTADPTKGGQELVDAFKSQYQAEKALEKPGWEKFNSYKTQPLANPGNFVGMLEDAIPGITEHINFDANGKASLEKWDSSMPLTKEAHSAVDQVLNAVNKDKVTLGSLRNVEKNVRSMVEFGTNKEVASQISGIYKRLRTYIADEVPDANFKELLKNHAITEGKRETIESILKGKISDYAPYQKQIVPEDALQKILANSNAASAAKDILPSDVFHKAIGDHLMSQMEKFTDDTGKGFSSAKWSNYLKAKAPELTAATQENPLFLERLRALSDKMKILPDSPPSNPSHSADKIISVLGGVNKFRNMFNPQEILGRVSERIQAPIEKARQAAMRDAVLSGKGPIQAEAAVQERVRSYGMIKTLQKYADKTTQAIESGAKSIFQYSANKVGAIGNAGARVIHDVESKSYDKLRNSILEHNANPEKLLEAISGSSQSLNEHAPDTAMAFSSAVGRAVTYLASQAPQSHQLSPMEGEAKPTKNEILQFNRQASLVEKPTNILGLVENGNLIPKDIEAVNSVHPALFGRMKMAVLEELSNAMTKPDFQIPYQRKLALSLFLGENLVSGVLPQNILASQAALGQMAQVKAANEMPKPSKSGMSKMKSQDGLLTKAQSSAMRQK